MNWLPKAPKVRRLVILVGEHTYSALACELRQENPDSPHRRGGEGARNMGLMSIIQIVQKPNVGHVV